MKYLIALLALLLVIATGCQYAPATMNQTNGTNTSIMDSITSANNTTAMSENETLSADVSTNTTNSTNMQADNDEKPTAIRNLPTKTVNEGESVQFKKDVAYDPDGDELTYSFSSPLNENGFWQTELGDAGEYVVTVSVTDGELQSSKQILLVVNSINERPVISRFEDIEVKEGDTIEFDPEITDADGDEVSIAYSGWMSTNSYETTFEDEGTYTVTLTASDGKQETRKSVEVRVLNTNRAPKLEGVEDIEVTEEETIDLDIEVSDADGDSISLTYDKPFDAKGSWKTKIGDAGTYQIDITADDGEDSVTETIEVKVLAKNNAPTVKVPEEIIVDEGDLIELAPIVDDEDEGDNLRITYSGFMTSSSYQTTYNDAGNYEVIVSVNDGIVTVSKTVEITIKDKNRAPQFGEDSLFE